MKLTITLDNLDEAIRQLKQLAKQIEDFPKDVAQESLTHIGYPDTGISSSNGVNRVFAMGDGIAFLEWGAGYEADFTTIEVDGVGSLPSYPGVWSDDHANTFKHHLYSGQPHGTYPYNRSPQNKMTNEAERLRRDTETKAKGYFR